MAEVYISYILHLAAAFVCASTYWRAARMEENGPPPILWALISLTTFALTWWLLNWTWPFLILAQLAIGLGIAIVRTIAYLRNTPK